MFRFLYLYFGINIYEKKNTSGLQVLIPTLLLRTKSNKLCPRTEWLLGAEAVGGAEGCYWGTRACLRHPSSGCWGRQVQASPRVGGPERLMVGEGSSLASPEAGRALKNVGMFMHRKCWGRARSKLWSRAWVRTQTRGTLGSLQPASTSASTTTAGRGSAWLGAEELGWYDHQNGPLSCSLKASSLGRA